jgi:hypothetical protein
VRSMTTSRQTRPVLVSLLIVLLVIARADAEPAANVDAREELSRLSKKYGISISTAAPFPIDVGSGVINARSFNEEHLKSYVPLLLDEWTLYPPQLVKRMGLWNIVLGEGLTYRGQERAGIPDYVARTLYLDIDRDRLIEAERRSTIHHEFFHLLDRLGGLRSENQDWATLNPAGFRYGTGGEAAQKAILIARVDLNLKGFINPYCMTAVEEDKAEMFAFMMVNGKEVEERAATDPVLHAKMLRMKELLHQLCPEANEDFWQAARRVQRPSLWPAKLDDAAIPVEPVYSRNRSKFTEFVHNEWTIIVVGCGLLWFIRRRARPMSS